MKKSLESDDSRLKVSSTPERPEWHIAPRSVLHNNIIADDNKHVCDRNTNAFKFLEELWKHLSLK